MENVGGKTFGKQKNPKRGRERKRGGREREIEGKRENRKIPTPFSTCTILPAPRYERGTTFAINHCCGHWIIGMTTVFSYIKSTVLFQNFDNVHMTTKNNSENLLPTGGCCQKNFQLVWWCHQLLSGFLTKGHVSRVSRQSRRSLMIKVIMNWSWGVCTHLLAFALRLRKIPENLS